MFSVAICDDEEKILDWIVANVKDGYKDKICFTVFESCEKLLNSIVYDEALYDGIIMDIRYRDGDGIEAVKKIYEVNGDVCIVYISGYVGEAERIFDTKPSYFLKKPITAGRLNKAIDRMVEEMERKIRHKVTLKLDSKNELSLSVDEIIYIESRAHSLVIHTLNDEYLIREKLDNIESRLGNAFLRTHKSYLINMKFIKERAASEFVLTTGEEIPISKSKYKEAREKYADYLGSRLWG